MGRQSDLRGELKICGKQPLKRLARVYWTVFRSTCFARASASAASARSLAATNNLAPSLIFLYAITICSIAPTPLSFGDWGAAPHSMPVAYSVPLNGWEPIRGLEFGLEILDLVWRWAESRARARAKSDPRTRSDPRASSWRTNSSNLSKANA